MKLVGFLRIKWFPTSLYIQRIALWTIWNLWKGFEGIGKWWGWLPGIFWYFNQLNPGNLNLNSTDFETDIKPSWEPSFRSRLCSAYFLGSLERISWVDDHGRISNLIKSSVKICSMWCLLWSIFFLYYYKEKIIPRGIGVWGSVFKDYYKRLRMHRRGSHCSVRFFILSKTRDSQTGTHDLIFDIPSHLKTRSKFDH